MSVFAHHIEKILFYDPGRALATVGAFSDECGKPGQFTYQLFLLAEIRTNEHSLNEQFIQELHTLLTRSLGSFSDFLSEARFEEGLHAINMHLPALFQDKDPSWLSQITFVIGAVHGTSLHLAQVGPSAILFMHRNKILDLNGYDSSITHNPLKLFKEVVTGRVEPGDTLFVATTNFLDYFSQEKIRRIIEDSDPEQTSKAFDNYLLQAPPSTSFGSLIISLSQSAPASIESYIDKSQEDIASSQFKSMEDLILREQKTEDILSPKLWPLIRKSISQWGTKIRFLFRKYVQKKPVRVSPLVTEQREELARDRARFIEQQRYKNRVTTHTGKEALTRYARKTSTLVSRLMARIFSKKESSAPIAPLVKPGSQNRKSALQWFSLLPNAKKLILILAILVLGALAQGIVWSASSKNSVGSQSSVEQKKASIQQLIADINAGFLYGDDSRITSSVTSLKDALSSLPSNRQYADIKKQAEETITQAEQRLQRIREISDPEQIADLSSLIDSNLSGLVLADSVLISTIPTKAKFSQTTIASGESIVRSLPENKGLLHIVQVDRKAWMLLQDFTVLEVGVGEKTTLLQTSFNKETTNLAAAATYLGRLYIVDVTSGQILRSNRGAATFGTPVPWLKKSFTFENARSMTVDGSIYVAFEDGKVAKFEQGNPVEFSLPSLLVQPGILSQIWTNESIDSVFILDSTNKRILVVTKQGKLLEQITFPNLSEVNGFAVNSKEKVLYVSSSNKLFKVSLPTDSL